MLKLKYLFENYSLAKKCIELYEYDKESIDDMLPYFRISSNAIYPFRAGLNKDKVCFLRLSPAEEKSLSEVLSEIQLIEWLIEKGFPAMRPVPMKNGELAGQIRTEWGNFNVSCFEKVPGKSLEETESTLQVARGYGQTLGKLHALMKEYPYQDKRRNHKDLLEEIGNRINTYAAPEALKREFLSLCEELPQLTVASTNYGVIHYDFEPDNVFYDEKENNFSVIDFDDAICCWYALDVVRAIDALDEVAKSYFMEGYRSATDFTEEQRQSLPLMRKLVRFQEYATILYVLSEPIDKMPNWMIELTNRLKYKLRRLEEAIVADLVD